MTFAELSLHCRGKSIQTADPKRKIYHLMTDSRQGIIRMESVFFAIRGVHHDGHQFIELLYRAGCRQFVVQEQYEKDLPDANVVLVEDSIVAIQAVVTAHRNQFSLPIIGITGSNGKTIVKEWLSQLVAAKYKVVKSPKSYNSQIGVPLSVWQLRPEHELGIFEAGISLLGEMIKLQKVIQPEIGIFTNLGPAHDQGFENRLQKALEKAWLFEKSKIIIYRKDYEEIDQVLRAHHAEEKLLSWTTNPLDSRASFQVKFSVSQKQGTHILIRQTLEIKEYEFTVSFQDDASLENVVHCIIFLLHLAWRSEDIQKGLDQLRQVKMRMELKEGINQCYLLDDSYSNDLAGLKIALDYLQRQAQNEKKTVILSDLLESGYSDEALYHEVVKLLQAHIVHKVILLGPRSFPYRHFFEKQSWEFHHYSHTDVFLKALKTEHYRQENILIKGARTFGFESIVRRLQQKITSTTLEINLDAIIHNLNYIRSLLKPQTKMMVMVKAFSYGGATFEIANLLQYHRVDYLAVAYVDEGVMLRQHGINTPILVLNPSVDSFRLMIEYQLEPEIYSLKLLKEWVEATQNEDAPPVHIKLDTGMHRLGFVESEVNELAIYLKQHPHLSVSSIFSHLVASEDINEDEYTLRQISRYEQMYEHLAHTLGYYPLRHILNSGGILRFSQYQFDMVRLGIGLYGIDVTGQEQSHLRAISTLKTVISQIKQLQVGETVGYNRRGKVDQPKQIATIAIGYADGLDRRLGNGQLKVWVNGSPAPTIGNICMDMSMIDISGIVANEGDEVIIFGEIQPVSVLASSMKTIPYEVLTGISARVKRVFFSDT